MQAFEAMRQEHIKAWQPLVSKRDNGVWAPACEIHTMAWKHWTDRNWEVPANSGNTMATAVQSWLNKQDKDGQHHVYEDVPWPGNKQCLTTHKS